MTFAGSCVCRPVGVTVSRVIAGNIPASTGCWAAAQATASSSSPVRGAEAVEGAGDRRGSGSSAPRGRAAPRPPSAARRRTLSAPAGTDAWPARPKNRSRSEATCLLADRDRHDAAPVGQLEQRAAALVERVVAAQVRALADEPGHPDVGGVALLVGLGDRGRRRRAARLPLRAELGERRRPGGQLALHVGGAAAEDPAVADARRRTAARVQSASGAGTTSVCAISMIDGPAAVALDPRDQVEALGIGTDELALDPGLGEVVGEQLARPTVSRPGGFEVSMRISAAGRARRPPPRSLDMLIDDRRRSRRVPVSPRPRRQP